MIVELKSIAHASTTFGQRGSQVCLVLKVGNPRPNIKRVVLAYDALTLSAFIGVHRRLNDLCRAWHDRGQ